MRISFDFDGVLCVTPFGRMATHAPSPVAELPDGYEALYDAPPRRSLPRLGVEYLRFGWRRIAPDAAETLHALAEDHTLYIVTGRSAAGESLLQRWLRRHKLTDRVAGVRLAPSGLRPAQHKLAIARMLNIDAHIDDDPRTAFHLARNGVPRVYLLAHDGAALPDDAPSALTIVRTLDEFREAIGLAPGDGEGRS